ncbi:MAG: hypothetical protein L3J41_14885 [Melioribacteraceae bacterium]|nr:hypothetical protein [Melioribacteraceae bacterium]
MKRFSIIIPDAILNLAIVAYPEIQDSRVELRIDKNNAKEILSFLLEKDKNDKYLHLKKFARILREVALGNYDGDLYDHEPPKGKHVTAMKFKGKENIRIACKEIFCGSKKVIMVSLFHKKSTKGKKISKRDLAIYEAVGGYEYEC